MADEEPEADEAQWEGPEPPEEPIDDVVIDETFTYAVDDDGMPTGVGMSPEQTRIGFGLFFHNKHKEAEDFFRPLVPKGPLFSLGYSSLLFVKACMSLEDQDMQAAIKALRVTEKMATRGAAMEGTLASWGRWLIGQPKKQRTKAQIQYEIMLSECKLLTAGLLFLSEGIIGKVKAAWNVRAAWNGYSRLWKEHEDSLELLDAEARAGLHIGIGNFNMMCSVLPPKILKFISILGFPSDREFGLEQFRKAFRSRSVRRPVAALGLLFHHIVLQGWSATGNNPNADESAVFMDEILAEFPDGGLFLFFNGRFKRLLRDLDSAEESFLRAIEVQTDWKQLRHLCYYELGWCYFFNFKWEEALTYFGYMYEQNEWSKGFYLYMMALCQVKLGKLADAIKSFETVAARDPRRYGGVLLSVDRFVFRKIASGVTEDKCTLVLPDIEITYMWNGFTQLPQQNVQNCLDRVLAWRSENASTMTPDSDAVTSLLLGSLYTELKLYNQAELALNVIEANAKEIKSDVYTIPFGRFQLASLWYRQEGCTPKVKAMIHKALAFSQKYDFEQRLSIRSHLALSQFKAV